MDFQRAKKRPVRNPEVVISQWIYTDEYGTVLRVGAKAYVMDGTDEEKLRLLRALSMTDFLSAQWEKVPKSFKLVGEGRELVGATTVDVAMNEQSLPLVFEPLYRKLESELPKQLRLIGGDYEEFAMTLSGDPLTVTTVVLEQDDGSLVPSISG